MDKKILDKNKNPDQLSEDIEIKYKVIAEYMAKNKLILNSDKTHLLVMTSSKRHRTHQDFGIYLNTGTDIIQPRFEERLLGANLSNDLRWNNHIRDTKASLINTLTSRINALRRRKMVANGIEM